MEPLEETIDLMIETMRSRHIQRLKTGECQIDGGTIYLKFHQSGAHFRPLLQHCGPHCGQRSGNVGNFDAHAFRRNMHDGFVPNFNEMLAKYKEKYYEPLCEM